MLSNAIEKAQAGESLSQDEMSEIVDQIMQGQSDTELTARLLTALYEKGETVEELAGAARAMRNHMNTIRCDHPRAVDTCGTGGSGKGTFNISTAAAFVAAACGTVVAKHGNRKATSNSGSTDVLAELGVAVDKDIASAERCLNEAGLCFCHAPLFHPSVRHVVPIRKALPHPTIFNLLGPLCNPALAPHQVLGAGRGETQTLIAEALAQLGTQHSIVIHGNDGLGEISCQDQTRVIEISNTELTETSWSPNDFGLEISPGDITASSPEQSAKMILDVFAGESGCQRDIVILNAAAAVWITGNANSLKDAAQRCSEAINSGAVTAKLEQLRSLTNA